MKKPERECKRWMAGYDRGGMPSGSPLINSTGGDTMQRLCHNCNFSIGAYGYCPHKCAKLSGNKVGIPVADGGGERRSATQTTIH